MSIPRTSLRSFLSNAKSALHNAANSSEKVTIVTGNESADLDSLTSSILYAYIRSSSPRSPSRLYIPLANLPASDIDIRPEFLKLLPYANIDKSHLITLDDLARAEGTTTTTTNIANGRRLDPEDTRWVLVDHNALQGQLGAIYGHRVSGVIDHHDEEGFVPQETGDEPRIVEKSGSCTSLITNYCREAWDEISASSLSSGAAHAQGDNVADDSAVTRTWDAQVAQFALASVLIDTANLTSEEKVTSHDVKAVEYLEAKIKLSPQHSVRYKRKDLYKEINAAKKDLDGLSLRDVLRKDYKEWTEKGKKLGISSVVKRLSWQMDKAKAEHMSTSDTNKETVFLETVRKHAESRDLDVVSIMTTSKPLEGEFKRELLVWALNPDCIPLMERFKEIADPDLRLRDWQVADLNSTQAQDDMGCRVWWQDDVGKSRKQVAPLLRSAMNG
ncbi:MAG: Exopolyphosphatase [Sclerophora amabilis]|nr:MAG: Exopolyphosphatase [Sclerophora amabilis]